MTESADRPNESSSNTVSTSKKKGKTRKINPLVKAVLWIFPPIYKLYMHFVFLTSRRVYYNYLSMLEHYLQGSSTLGAIWHQDVILVPFTFRNYNVVTMVSKSDLGEVMAFIVRRMGFVPVRGGSSMAGGDALADVINYIRSHKKILFGITVDGSRGPKYKVKKGVIVVAKESGVPIYPVKTCAKRKLFLPTWDSTLIPLPFNEFAYFIGDPVHVPPDASLDVIEAKRQELENALMRLTKRADEHFTKGSQPKEYPNEAKVVHYWTDMAGRDY
jgi:lysophospholipid acyltransferase (LPLAT)-like uncharacterized protein